MILLLQNVEQYPNLPQFSKFYANFDYGKGGIWWQENVVSLIPFFLTVKENTQ